MLLTSSGIAAKVVSVTVEPVGTGQMARSVRLRPVYAGEHAGAPRSLVVKVPSQDPRSRKAGGGANGFYAREVRFYADFAAAAGARIPRCYHASLEPDTGAFLILLEDLAPARQGDQIAGVTRGEADLVVREAARLHASYWNDATLDELPWLVGSDAGRPRWNNAAKFAAMWGSFVTRYGNRLTQEASVAGDTLVLRYDRFLEYRSKARCLVHNDFRPDNLMFGNAEGQAAVWVVDWQTVGVGAGAGDLAYFLAGAMEPKARRATEEQLLALYLATLREAGVVGYGMAELAVDYAYASFLLLMSTVVGALIVGQSDRGDAMFLRMIDGAADQIAATHALDLL